MRRYRRDLADHDVGRGTGDVRQIVVLGDPIARIAEPVGKRARSSELRSATEPGVTVVTGDRSRTEIWA